MISNRVRVILLEYMGVMIDEPHHGAQGMIRGETILPMCLHDAFSRVVRSKVGTQNSRTHTPISPGKGRIFTMGT